MGNYESMSGYSGALIITVENGINKLIGVHKGNACEFTTHLETGDVEFDLRGQASNCRGNMGDHQHLKSFSPWQNVKDVLHLR